MHTPDVRPVAGYALLVRCGAACRVVWWGPTAEHDEAPDVVAVAGGRVLTWADAGRCQAEVVGRGWCTAAPFPDELDLTSVLEWIRGRRLRPGADAALSTWNLTGDVAVSLGRRRADRGRGQDRCYDLLFAEALPHLAQGASLRRDGRDVDVLRARLSADLALLRTELSLR